MDIEKFWRYSLDCGGGGIVVAGTAEEAVYKIKAYYNSRRFGKCISLNKDELTIWPLLNDDYYDFKHPDIIDCY